MRKGRPRGLRRCTEGTMPLCMSYELYHVPGTQFTWKRGVGAW